MANKKKKTEAVKANEYEPTQVCRQCQGTDHERITAMASSDYHGTTADGFRYTSTDRFMVRCSECDQRSIMKVYRFDPNQWKG